MRFTKPSTAALTLPKGKSDHIVFDDALPGFGLRIRDGGRRVWICQYRTPAGQRRVTIGRADVIELEDARREAKAILAKAALGHDPQAEKAKAKAEARITFKSVVDTYLTQFEKTVKPDSARAARRYLLKSFAALHDQPLAAITRRSIAAELTRIVEASGNISANRARSALSSFFAWCMAQGLLDANPTLGTLRMDEKSRDRVLSSEEIAAIWKACDGEDSYSRIVRLLLLTGQRRLEIGDARWSEIEIDRARMILPAARSKNGRAHEIPLAPAALDIIRSVERRGDEDRLFVTQRWWRAKVKLDERIRAAGATVAPWTLHDLRRTLATGLADLGVLPHVVEAVLNHQSGSKSGVAGTYNRSTYAAEKRAALDLWANHVTALVEGKAPNVVPLRAGDRA